MNAIIGEMLVVSLFAIVLLAISQLRMTSDAAWTLAEYCISALCAASPHAQPDTAFIMPTRTSRSSLKYPHMFRASSIMITNKIDLLPHLDFDLHKAIKNALAVNPNITTYRLSARSGEGLVAWYN